MTRRGREVSQVASSLQAVRTTTCSFLVHYGKRYEKDLKRQLLASLGLHTLRIARFRIALFVQGLCGQDTLISKAAAVILIENLVTSNRAWDYRLKASSTLCCTYCCLFFSFPTNRDPEILITETLSKMLVGCSGAGCRWMRVFGCVWCAGRSRGRPDFDQLLQPFHAVSIQVAGKHPRVEKLDGFPLSGAMFTPSN